MSHCCAPRAIPVLKLAPPFAAHAYKLITKREMVCTGLPEAMLISSTALTMTWMAPSLTALKPFGPVLVLSNLCKLPADLYRGTSSFLGGVADKENKIGLHLSPLQFVIKKKNVHQHYILCRFECPRQVSKEFWS